MLAVWFVVRRRTLELKEMLLVLFIGLPALLVNGLAYTKFDRQDIGDLQWAANGNLQIVTVLAIGLNFGVARALTLRRTHSTQEPQTNV